MIESAATPEIQKQAEALGWIPVARYKGPEDRFIDAEEFIERGEQILPIVKAQKRELEGQVQSLTQKTQHLEGIILKNQETMEALEEFHTAETKRRVEQVRKDLKKELAAASEAGNHEAVAELTDQMTQLNEKVEETKEPPKGEKRQEPPPLDPILVNWAKENGKYLVDHEYTALANAVAVTLRREGNTSTGRAFLDLVAERTEEKLGGEKAERPSADKSGGGSNGSGRTRSSGGKGYRDMPADAKAACDSFASRLVGEGRRYKDAAAYQASYAKTYFEEV